MAKGMPEGIKVAMQWALGIGIIALVLLVMLILFGNLQGNVGFGKDSTTYANESITLVDSATGDTLAQIAGKINPVATIITIYNGSTSVSSANWTLTPTTGLIVAVNGSLYNATTLNVTYSVSYDSEGKINTDNVVGNYTQSATNLSIQFPTVGTIVGIALLLIVLIGVLVFAVRKLTGVAGGSSSSRSGSFEVGSGGGFG